MSAAWTRAATRCPAVSVMMWRLRPLTFLPASKPRGPPLSVVFEDWLSNHPGRRAGLASGPFAGLLQQQEIDGVPQPGRLPKRRSSAAPWSGLETRAAADARARRSATDRGAPPPPRATARGAAFRAVS